MPPTLLPPCCERLPMPFPLPLLSPLPLLLPLPLPAWPPLPSSSLPELPLPLPLRPPSLPESPSLRPPFLLNRMLLGAASSSSRRSRSSIPSITSSVSRSPARSLMTAVDWWRASERAMARNDASR